MECSAEFQETSKNRRERLKYKAHGAQTTQLR